METLAHIALIARFGPGWFRQLGTAAEPGSMLCTVLHADGTTRERWDYVNALRQADSTDYPIP